MKYDKFPNWYLPAVLCFLVFASFNSMLLPLMEDMEYYRAIRAITKTASFASMMAILDWHSNHKKWTKADPMERREMERAGRDERNLAIQREAAQFTRTITHAGMLVVFTVLSFLNNFPGQAAVAALYVLDIIVYDIKRNRLDKEM